MAERFKEVTLEKRDCDVCGSQDLKSLWSYEKTDCVNGSSTGFISRGRAIISRNSLFSLLASFS
jgi:hypothetical protein